MTTNDFNVIKTITKLGDKLHHSKMLKSNFRGSKKLINLLCNYLDINEEECLIFVVVFVVQIQDGAMELRDFSRFLDLSFVQAIEYKVIIESLTKKKIISAISKDRHSSASFYNGRYGLKINPTIMEAIFENVPIASIKDEEVDIYEFNRRVSNLIKEREDEDIVTNELFMEVELLENKYSEFPITSLLKSMKVEIEDRTFLYEMADDCVTSGSSSLNRTIKDIYDSIRKKKKKSREILEGNSILISKNLISVGEATFFNDINIQLTDNAIEMFFRKDAEIFLNGRGAKNLILNKNIKSKELFFSEQLNYQVGMIISSLTSRNFDVLQERMLKNSLPKGIAAVFYGAPGTGKTETVYQIAKATGRDIMHVDLSDTKSMWFGQSEKKIKEIFTDYTKACKAGGQKPILLFNEADGVLSKRNHNTHTSVDQTENTIQNILLEEFEKNEGIIIATTNLVDNLDEAFERRFLFKLEFQKPDKFALHNIWKSKLEWLDNEMLSFLATNFTFSGGEIDNIVRKIIMEEVLTGIRPNLTKIESFCRAEKLCNEKFRVRIGF